MDETPAPDPDLSGRRPAGSREHTTPTLHHALDEVAEALAAAGFVEVDVRTTGRFFLLATAVAR